MSIKRINRKNLQMEDQKQNQPIAEEAYGQFIDIESPEDYDKSIYEKSRNDNMMEAHAPFEKFKSCIDYSYAEKYAPEHAKRVWQEVEDERREMAEAFLGI